MSDETRKPPRRWPWFVLLALFLGTLVGGGAWLLGPKVWIDGQGLRVPGNVARIRDVVWDPPKPVVPEFQSDQQQYEPSLSPDGNEFYFVRNKPGQNADIYVSYRRNNQWTQPQALEAVNGPYDDLGPRVTADGKFLLFYSDRPGGFGGYDIWASERTEAGWGTPFNLGPGVNSEYNEFSPDPTPDGKHLIFATNRKAAQGEQKQAWRATIRESGTGDYDLWIADLQEIKANAFVEATAPAGAVTQPSNTASASTTEPSPALVAQPAHEIPGINTSFMEGASCMSPAGDYLYFASNRPGGFGKFDIYRSRISVAPDGSWKFDHPENAGAQINTAENETDPAIALNGFRLYFSTDRDNRDGVYRVLVSDSREVFPIHEGRRALPHPTLSLWLMLASLLVLVPLLLMLRGWDDRKLGMLQKCLLLSLLVHVGICFALSFLKVTAQAYHLVRQEMGVEIPVALSAPREAEVGYAIRHQSSSDLPIPGAPPEPLPQSQTPVESTVVAGPIEVSTPVAQAQSQSQSLVLEIPRAASPLPSATPDSVAAAAPSAQVFQPTVQTAVAVQQPEAAPLVNATNLNLARSENAAQLPAGTAAKAVSSDAPPLQENRSISPIAPPVRAAAPVPASSNAPNVAPSAADLLAAVTPTVNGVPSSANASRVKGQNEATPSAREIPVSIAAQTAAAPSEHPNQANIDVPQALPSAASSTDRTSALASAPRQAIDVSNPDSVRALPEDSLSVARLPAINGVPLTPATRARAEEQKAVATDVAALTTRPIADASAAQQLLAAPRLETTSAPPTAGGARESLASQSPQIASRSAPITTTDAPSTSVTAATPSITDAPSIGLPNASGTEKLAAPVHSPDSPVASAIDTLVASKKSHAPEGGGAPANIPIDTGNTPVAAAAKIAGVGGADSLQSRPRPTEIASASVAPDVASIVPPEIGPALPKVPESPFRMRAAEQHKPVIEQLGGTKESETAVDRGLAYLAGVQENDGHWTMVTNSQRALRNARHPHDSATTGLAMLAFLAQDHRPDKPGPYQQVVSQSLDFLLSQQQDNGDLRGAWAGGGADQGNMYDHGIATFALAEAALITRDPRYTEAAFKGARFIVSAQNRETGGWRYTPGEYGDSSVFGWQVMALHSAEQLGFEIPAATHRGMVRYIALASSGAQRMLAGYQPRESPTAPMTAEIVFCRMLLGQQLNDDEAEEVANFLARQPPQTGNPDIYCWYYGSLCMMQMQSDAWKQWNTRTRDMLVRTQRKVGDSAGYWDNMKWGDRGGRVFTTAMATLTLEVYYRYMPLQKKAEEVLPAGAAQPAEPR